jgi:aminopeptidase N
MHAAELTIENAELTEAEHRRQITEIEMREMDERTILHFSKKLKAVTSTLFLFKFYKKIGRSPVGLNESSYVTKQGEEQWILSTLLAPINTRRLFSCSDERNFKATFSMSMVAERKLEVLSNMDVAFVIEFTGYESYGESK